MRILTWVPLAVLVLAACDLPFGLGEGGDDALATNRARWERRGFASYELTLVRTCFCATIEPVRIVVRDNSRVSTVFIGSGTPVPAELVPFYPTITGLFDLLADAYRRKADQVDVRYDPELGYPQRIYIDYARNIADEEVTYEVSALNRR